MMTNMGKLDRGARVVIALVLLFLALVSGVLGSGVLFYLAIGVAVVFTVSALVGNCPLYSIIGLKTCRDC
jgi:FtsH-binding integral membrane protein